MPAPVMTTLLIYKTANDTFFQFAKVIHLIENYNPVKFELLQRYCGESYELRFMNYELRFTIYELRFVNYDLRFAIINMNACCFF